MVEVGQSRRVPDSATAVRRLRSDRPVFSVEFLAPRDDTDERTLWRAVRELERMDPAFVSVTYGAGGSTRDRTIRTTGRLAQETTLVTMAHLTGVNHTISELRNMIGWYASLGIRNILALRGDPPGDPMGDWVPHPGGITYAEELVALTRELGDFCIGVAAFPYGHPRSTDLDSDTTFLCRKFDAGADFAIAQLFFEVDDFLRLRDRAAARGRDEPILPGIMPLVSPRTLAKTEELSGALAPASLRARLDPLAGDPAAFRAEGIDIATGLCARLIAEGVTNLHFYTMNRAKATREVITRLDLLPARS